MIVNLLTALLNKLITFVQWVFNQIFGNWNWQILFNWLPNDILTAAGYFILVLFCIALFRLIKDILPI